MAFEVVEAGAEPGRRVEGDGDDVDPEDVEVVAVAGIAGFEDGDPLARLEQGQEAEHTTPRRPGRDHDPVGPDLDAIAVPVPVGDRLPEGRQPGGAGIAERVRLHGGSDRRSGSGRGRGRRLADLEVQHRQAGGLPGLGGPHDFHHVERSDATPGRRFHGTTLASSPRR